jgi:predicted N-formylglutamate amidohydrolase
VSPFEVVNPDGRAPALVICDHASRFVPPEYDNLGVAEAEIARHIGWDIGAGDVARELAQLIDASAVLCGTSRLVIDCNRRLDDPSSIPEASDGTPVPGNQGLEPAERKRRAERFFMPYHAEIERRLDAFVRPPALVSVHSFTPVMAGFDRPWHVGLLYDEDDRLARPIIEALRREAGLVVGDNEPYSGRRPVGYALGTYANGRGLPPAVFELRQDLIDTPEKAHVWARRLAHILRPLLGSRIQDSSRNPR